MYKLELIDFENKYAESVAEMWNKSRDSWGGDDALKTKESVISNEANSPHLELILGKYDNDIIGYCKLSIDRLDEGALYIDLLNVRTDFHGKSFGKQLLLESINRTIKRRYNRVDLHTWAGNTKAVPLYKKCGFFWEKRDNTTHLINLMPFVLKCELVEEFFKTVDWYKDSVREIEIKPDSRIENKFDLWNYVWKKDNKNLNMEFTRRGRGLKKIENDEFSVEVIVEDLQLVFGDEYKVKYKLTNKTLKPLRISIKGEDDKNIKFNYENSFDLIGTREVETTFFVSKIVKNQKENKTHPVVKSIITINNKSAIFKTGIEPLFPLNIELKSEADINRFNVETNCFLNIENHFNESVKFGFEIPNSYKVKFTKKLFNIELKAKEKKTIGFTYFLSEATSLNEELKIKVQRKNKKEFTFNKVLNMNFQGSYGSFYSKSEELYVIANGEHKVELNRENNASIVKIAGLQSEYAILPIRLGKPYTREFDKKKNDKVEFEVTANWIQMKLYYSSEEFSGISFIKYFKLFNDGLLETYHEISNYNNEDTSIYVSEALWISIENGVIPYNNKIITMENDIDFFGALWSPKNVTENWIFIKGKKYTRGISWSNECELKISNNQFSFDSHYKVLKSGKKEKSKSLFVGTNSFLNYHDLREFSLGKTLEKEEPIFSTECSINNGNPFSTSDISVNIVEHKKMDLEGVIIVKNDKKIYERAFKENELLKAYEFNLTSNKDRTLLTVDINLVADQVRMKRLVYKKSRTEIINKISKISQKEVLSVNNGLLEFKSALDFAPAIFSIEFNNKEWLSSSFPTPCSKSWWNPWIGGSFWRPVALSLSSILEEKSTSEFVDKKDNFGNIWSGIKISTVIEKNEKNKGMAWHQYYLTLPGVPVLVDFIEVDQNKFEFLKSEVFENDTFLVTPEKLERAYFEFKNKKDRVLKIVQSKIGRDHSMDNIYEFKIKDSEDFITIFNKSDFVNSTLYMNTDIISIYCEELMNCESNKIKVSKLSFKIFGKEKIEEDWLLDYRNIKFD